MLALVAHGAVLDGPGEDDGVAGLALDLDGVLEELALVLGEGGHEVREGPDGGAAVLLGEVRQEGHELDRLKCRRAMLFMSATPKGEPNALLESNGKYFNCILVVLPSY